MGVLHGLSVDGVKYFRDVIENKKVPDWMEFGIKFGKLTGHYEIVNFINGYQNMDQFLFRLPKWPIGGLYFDGIMRTEHTSRIRPTTYPVQTGVTMTDHAIIEPAELTIEIMVSDATPLSVQMNPVLMTTIGMYLGKLSFLADIYTELFGVHWHFDGTKSDGRAVQAYGSLRALQLARTPITVETRLGTYNNMLIEELSTPDDVNTLHALRCTVRMREVIVAKVAETAVSARAAANAEESNGGQTPVKTEGADKTLAKAIGDAV